MNLSAASLLIPFACMGIISAQTVPVQPKFDAASVKLDTRGIALDLVERPFLLGAERCWRLGMMICEIITNSARHAFDESGGKITVELQPVGAFVSCIVADNGRGAPAYRAGHGSSIIRAVVDSLEGTLDQNFGPRGAVTTLIFPVEPATRPAKSLRRPTSRSAGISMPVTIP